MGGSATLTPIVSKLFCSPSQVVLMVRKRPHIVNGGGFVAMDRDQGTVFSVDGCGVLGVDGELIVRDGDGTAILFIRKKGGVVQALSFHNWWKGYLVEYDEPSKLVFTLQDPKPVVATRNSVRISIKPQGSMKDWDFEVIGSFVERACTMKDRRGNIVAQVGVKEMTAGRDFYHVAVQPGYDQAFVVGVLAVLDNIHGESTRC